MDFLECETPGCRIPILRLGDSWLAIEKPEGLSVHNDPGGDLITLITMQRDKLRGWDVKNGVHAVHRLDRDTSGVILLAGRTEIRHFFSIQFEKRAVSKTYQAILHGAVPSPDPTPESWGSWNWPLAKEAAGRKNPSGGGLKQPALTRYRVLRRTAHYSLVELLPETGRRHQLRRHASLAGHPIVGDSRYGSSRALSFLKNRADFHRLGLHAHSLTLVCPEAPHLQTIVSTGLPETMQSLLKRDNQ